MVSRIKQSQPLPPERAVCLKAMALDENAESAQGAAMAFFARDLQLGNTTHV